MLLLTERCGQVTKDGQLSGGMCVTVMERRFDMNIWMSIRGPSALNLPND